MRMCGGEVSVGKRGKGGISLYFESEVSAEVTTLGFSGGPLMTYSVEVDLN